MNCPHCKCDMPFDERARAYQCSCGHRIDRGGLERSQAARRRAVAVLHVVVGLSLLGLGYYATFVGEKTYAGTLFRPYAFWGALLIALPLVLRGMFRLVNPPRD